MKKQSVILGLCMVSLLLVLIAGFYWLQAPAKAPAAQAAESAAMPVSKLPIVTTPEYYPLLTQGQLVTESLDDMVFVKGGSYLMGTGDKRYMDAVEDNAHPHQVTLMIVLDPGMLL